MKILLAACNAKYIHSNLAVYDLKAYSSDYDEQVLLREYTINQPRDEILKDIYSSGADVVCFSCYIWNISFVRELIRDLAKILPQTVFWAGGPEVSYDAEKFLTEMPEMTGVMVGEGEKTFHDLLEFYIDGKGSLEEISGIAYRSGSKICHNGWRELMDLSEIPFVYEHLEDFENRIIYYESSRGCPFSCSYCLSSIDKKLRFRDLDLVKKELQFFLDHKVPQVKFVDRTFNCNHKRSMEIWKYLIEHDKGMTNFHFEVAADLLNEEELDLIAKMRPGLIQLEIGVQSTNEETIREIKRTMKFPEVARIVTCINEGRNVHQHLDLIAGLPFEGIESFRKSFDDVYRLYPEQLQLGFLKVLKGSYMEEQRERYGLVYKSKPPYEVLCTNWLTYEDVLRLKRIEDMVEVYYNSGQFTYTLRHLEKEFESAFELYDRLGEFYEDRGLHLMSHSRIARYEILLDFICNLKTGEEELYRELLTFDLYLRENVKNRPEFVGDYTVSREMRRNYPKQMHLEKFRYDVMGDCREDEQILLFDYENRSKLTRQAYCKKVENSLQ